MDIDHVVGLYAAEADHLSVIACYRCVTTASLWCERRTCMLLHRFRLYDLLPMEVAALYLCILVFASRCYASVAYVVMRCPSAIFRRELLTGTSSAGGVGRNRDSEPISGFTA